MIRKSSRMKTTTIHTENDRFVTPTVTFDGTGECKHVAVAIPTLDDASAVILEVAPREHRFNYPALSGKAKPEGRHGYADNGIILEWDFDDADGTTITDEVQGIVLTEQGNPTFTTSAATVGLGNGVVFDGTGDAFDYTLTDATVTASLNLPTTGDFSVEVVFKGTNASVGDGDTLVCCRDGAAGVGWQMHFDANQFVDFHIEDATAQVELTGATDAATDAIVHAVVTLDRDGDGKIYINGALDDTTAISGSPGTVLNESADTRIAIGGDAARTAGDCFYGTIYFVRVYNKVLSATEVVDNYRTLLNLGFPGWAPLADPPDGDDLVISKSGSAPNYYDLSEFQVLRNMAFRAVCSVEQTTTPVNLDFVWVFD